MKWSWKFHHLLPSNRCQLSVKVINGSCWLIRLQTNFLYKQWKVLQLSLLVLPSQTTVSLLYRKINFRCLKMWLCTIAYVKWRAQKMIYYSCIYHFLQDKTFVVVCWGLFSLYRLVHWYYRSYEWSLFCFYKGNTDFHDDVWPVIMYVICVDYILESTFNDCFVVIYEVKGHDDACDMSKTC